MTAFQRLAVAIVLLLLPLRLWAAEPRWFKVTSDHFLLFTDTSELKGQRLLTDFETRLSAFESALGHVPARQFPVEVFLFSRAEDVIDAVPRGETDVDKAAYVIRGPDRVFVIARDKSPETIANDVGHALGHVFFERMVLWRPFWLAEGAAEYFRKVGRDPDNKRISADDASPASDLLHTIPSATYQDQEVHVVSPTTYQEKDFGVIFRIQAHRLLRMILDQYPSEFRGFMESLRTEDGGQVNLPVDKGELNDRLGRYTEVRINPGKAGSPTRVETAATDELSIQRGDLMLATGKTAEAAQWYKAETPQALAARAILARFTRTGGEAIRLLDRAAAGLPDSGLVRFHLGSIDTAMPKDVELQAASLQKAAQLLPALGAVQAQLARVYTVMGRPMDALPLLDRAIAMEPESADRFYVFRADALLAAQRYDEAYKTMQVAAALPHSDRNDIVAYGLKTVALAKKIEDIRREADARRLAQIRSEVEARAAIVDPPRPAPLPPAPIRSGQVMYDMEATQRVEVINSTLPVYPDVLVQKGTAGKITLKVAVGLDGKVADVTLVTSRIPEMNAATIAAVKKWTFKPVQRAGRAVPFNISLVFQYDTQ